MLAHSIAMTVGVGLSVLSLAACQSSSGNGETRRADSAGAGDEATIERCSEPVGLASVVQPGDATLERLESLELGSPLPFLRMMMVRSNCFQVVDSEVVAEADLADELHFAIRPQVTLSDPDAGAVEGVGNLTEILGLSRMEKAGGNVEVQEVEAVLFLSDAKTGLLRLAAEGSATAHDLSGFALGSLGELRGAEATAEGELFAAAFLDALNNLVVQIRDQSAPTVAAEGSTS